MDEQLDASRAGIGEELGVVDAGGAKDLDDTGQQPVGASTHVHGLYCQPQGINADHRNQSRNQAPQAAASCAGQSTTAAEGPRRNSR